MKLRNKKTGEIGELKPFVIDEKIAVWIKNKSYPEYRYSSLAKFNKEWEEYVEPKEYWYIDWNGEVCRSDIHDERTVQMKLIGNYFETKEEAEKAVEKLKAWTRLRDKGFRFKCWYGGSKNIDWEITSFENGTYIPRQICDDLDLLFGGE